MQYEDVEIGKSYLLIDLSLAKEIDANYSKYGYNNSTGIYGDKKSFFGGSSSVKIMLDYSIRYPRKFLALFPNGIEYLVVAEWLLPTKQKVSLPKIKRTIRLIRG